MKPSTKRILFYVVITVLLFAPVVAMIYHWVPRDPIVNVSVLLGFLGLSLAGIQLVPIGKMRWVADSLNMDKVYGDHHNYSLLAIGLVLSHPLILLITDKVYRTNWVLWAGWIGLAALVFIGFTSALRKQLKIDYVHWLGLHNLLTLAILVFGMWHMYSVNYYMRFPLIRWVWIVEIAVWVILTIYIRFLNPLRISKSPYKVESVTAQPNSVYTLTLVPDGHEGVPFKAGQIAWISTSNSSFSISRNPFSYSGSEQAEDGRLRFSIKEVGDFTFSVKDLRVGDRVFVDGPYGAFDLDNPETQRGLVMIAGGIGIAPILSLLKTLGDSNDDRPLYLFYGDQTEETKLYQEELNEAIHRTNMQKLVIVLERPISEDYPYQGYISEKTMRPNLPEDYKSLYYFVCGPPGLVAAMDRNFKALDVPSHRIHVENYEMA